MQRPPDYRRLAAILKLNAKRPELDTLIAELRELVKGVASLVCGALSQGLIGSALVIAYVTVVWLARGRTAQRQPAADVLPGSIDPVPLNQQVILFAIIRAVALSIAVAIAFGLHVRNAAHEAGLSWKYLGVCYGLPYGPRWTALGLDASKSPRSRKYSVSPTESLAGLFHLRPELRRWLPVSATRLG